MSLKDILKAYYDISYLLFLILFSLSHIQYFVQKERYIFPAIKITSRHKVTNKTNLD
jgi:hypothetical protein